jgi:hypothetical protein
MTGGGGQKGVAGGGRCRQSPNDFGGDGPDRRNQDDAHWAAVSKCGL